MDKHFNPVLPGPPSATFPAESDVAIRRDQLLESARQDRSYASFFGIARALSRLKAPLEGHPLRIALLGTATLDPIVPYLQVHASLAGFSPQIYVGPFNQVRQEIFRSDSGLAGFQPDVVILACEGRDLLGELYDAPLGSPESRLQLMQEVLEALVQEVEHLLATHDARVLVHNLAPPSLPLFGLLDAREPYGSGALVREFNTRLEDRLRPLERAFVVDYHLVLARVGLDIARPEPRRFLARIACDRAAIPLLVKTWERYFRALFLPPRKVLVLDLDNTLWGGVIGEDGLEGIRLGHDAPGNCYLELQRVALRLSQRGVILALCSKNNLEDALDALNHHPAMLLREGSFAAIRCNWREKSLNLEEIAAELNLGLEALVFVDDNPVERARVREALPQVLVPELPADPALYAQTVAALSVFDSPSLTDEDRRRGQLYAQRRQTEALRAGSASLEDFLFSLETVLTLRPLDRLSLSRSAQLEARTNQFNMTTRRYQDADLERLRHSPAHTLLTVGLQDRFGDQGQVGLVVLERQEDDLVIESLLLSCRVLGRGVEQALLAHLEALARASGARRLVGRLRLTPKNKPARSLYPDAGMETILERDDRLELARSVLGPSLEVPGWVKIITDGPRTKDGQGEPR